MQIYENPPRPTQDQISCFLISLFKGNGKVAKLNNNSKNNNSNLNKHYNVTYHKRSDDYLKLYPTDAS